MVYRTSDQKIAEYELDGSLNQSGIKVILKDGIQEFLEQKTSILKSEYYYSEKKSHIIGKAVDCIITGEEGSFAKKYYGDSGDKPTPAIMSIVKWVHDAIPSIVRDSSIETHSDKILDGCIEHNYQPKWKPETKINRVVIDGQGYWQQLLEAEGRQVLDEHEYSTSQIITNNILTHPHTANLFKDDKYVDIVYQFPIYFTFLDILCKGLLDVVRIDHTLRRIYPIDIKTTCEHILLFNEVIRTWRYDIQAAFYRLALENALVELSNLIATDVTKYEIRDFCFVAESTTKPGTPLKFPLSREVLEIGKAGDGRFKGYYQGVLMYKAWLDKQFSIESMFEVTNGTVIIEKDYTYNYPNQLIF